MQHHKKANHTPQVGSLAEAILEILKLENMSSLELEISLDLEYQMMRNALSYLMANDLVEVKGKESTRNIYGVVNKCLLAKYWPINERSKLEVKEIK